MEGTEYPPIAENMCVCVYVCVRERDLGTPRAVQKSSLMSQGLQNRLNTTWKRGDRRNVSLVSRSPDGHLQED